MLQERLPDVGFRVARSVVSSTAKSGEGEFPGLPEFPEAPAAATAAPAADSPDGWGEPVNLGPTVNSAENDAEPALSADGLVLVFQSDRPGGQGAFDLWMCTRASCDEPFGQAVNLGARVNSGGNDLQPALSADGLTLVFTSDRPGGQGGYDLWMSKRASREGPFGDPVNLGPVVNSSHLEGKAAFSADGLTLLFGSNRPGGHGEDLWMCQRASPTEPFGQPVNLGPTVNSSAREYGPALSADGLRLYFASDRPGGQGDFDLWMASRTSVDGPFGQPVNLGPVVNSAGWDAGPALLADGLTLLFHAVRPGGHGGYDLWMCTRPPRAGSGGGSSGPFSALKPKPLSK